MGLQIPQTLTHITDVGKKDGRGSDSVWRIWQQYRYLRVDNPHIITAGRTPLDVAFTACTHLRSQAREKAEKTLKFLGIENAPPQVIALNSSPRTEEQQRPDAQEDYIYRVITEDGDRLLIYGPEVLQWVIAFRNDIQKIERIIAVKDIIPNTSKGSQFRSGENLPVVHVLEAVNKLDEIAEKEEVPGDSFGKIYAKEPGKVYVVPHDEYDNQRIITPRITAEEIAARSEIWIPEITDRTIKVRETLTDVLHGEIAVWNSSNALPDADIVVMNLGTRWKPDYNTTTDPLITELSSKLASKFGQQLEVRF